MAVASRCCTLRLERIAGGWEAMVAGGLVVSSGSPGDDGQFERRSARYDSLNRFGNRRGPEKKRELKMMQGDQCEMMAENDIRAGERAASDFREMSQRELYRLGR